MNRRVWILGALIVLVVVVRRGHHPDACALAQTWTAGDVHQYEVLTLAADGTGHWGLGSYDDDIEPDAQDFSWEAAGSTLIVTTEDGRRTLTYAIERSGRRCTLSLDDYPLARSHERYWYTGGL